MKNILFFVILALLTLVALVSFSTAKNRLNLGGKLAITKPTPTPSSYGGGSPTPETGSALGRTSFGTGGQATSAAIPSYGDTTKGGLPLLTPTPTVHEQAQYQAPQTLGTTTERPTIFYELGGFRPQQFTVKKGTMVVFKNLTDRSMRIVGDDSARQVYPLFSQKLAVGKNGFFEFEFTNTGTFVYHDANTSGMTGTVVVTN